MGRPRRTLEGLNDLMFLIGLSIAIVTVFGSAALFYYAYNANEAGSPLAVLIVWLCLAFVTGLIFPHRITLVLAVLPWPVGYGASYLAGVTGSGLLGKAWYLEGAIIVALGVVSAWLGIRLHRYLASVPHR